MVWTRGTHFRLIARAMLSNCIFSLFPALLMRDKSTRVLLFAGPDRGADMKRFGIEALSVIVFGTLCAVWFFGPPNPSGQESARSRSYGDVVQQSGSGGDGPKKKDDELSHYLTPAGELKHKLVLKDAQEGVIGTTGRIWTIEESGRWSIAGFLQEGPGEDQVGKPSDEGRLSRAADERYSQGTS